MRTFKDFLGLCFTFISVSLLLFLGARYYFWENLTEIGALSCRWNLDIPRSAKLEEVHTNIGFQGDGWRLLVFSCDVKKIKDTKLDYTKYHASLDSEAMEVITKNYDVFLEEHPSCFDMDSEIKVKKIKKGKPLRDPEMPEEAYVNYTDILVIVYDVIEEKYYIFEEIL